MNNETTVTVLFNDMNPPAGSVDELYNADFYGGLALPPNWFSKFGRETT